MKIRCCEFNIAEARSAKFSKVFRVTGDREEARVFLA